MNFTQLKYFNAICEHKSVSLASKLLFVSQPTVSNAIKELEDEFGCALFKRHHKGMALTAEGELLYTMSSDIVSRFCHIEQVMSSSGKNNKTVRLGVPPMIGSLFLPHIQKDFNNSSLSVRLDIFEGGKNELINKLENNLLDMIFLSHNEPLPSKLSTLFVTNIETVFCVSKKHPLSKYKTVTPEDLKDVPLVLFKNSFFQTELIKEYFSGYNISPKILFQTEQLSNILAMIEDNTAAGFLFKPLTKKHPDLTAISVKDRLFADISLVWKKDSYISSGMKTFENYIRTNKERFKI